MSVAIHFCPSRACNRVPHLSFRVNSTFIVYTDLLSHPASDQASNQNSRPSARSTQTRRLSWDATSWMLSKACYKRYSLIFLHHPLHFNRTLKCQLRAFEKLLHDYPEWQRKVVLIQVCPTRIPRNRNGKTDGCWQVTSPALTDSPKLERQVSELVAHINGEYGSLDFIPVHH